MFKMSALLQREHRLTDDVATKNGVIHSALFQSTLHVSNRQ